MTNILRIFLLNRCFKGRFIFWSDLKNYYRFSSVVTLKCNKKAFSSKGRMKDGERKESI